MGEYIKNTQDINQEQDRMHVIWLSHFERGGFTSTFRESLVIAAFGGGTLGRIEQWCRVASCKYAKDRENLNDGKAVNLLR